MTEEGIKMQDDYVVKIINWPEPQTPKGLSSFLRFNGYYHSFIPEYSKLTCEMNSQKREKQLEWTKVMDEYFQALEECFNRRHCGPTHDLGRMWRGSR